MVQMQFFFVTYFAQLLSSIFSAGIQLFTEHTCFKEKQKRKVLITLSNALNHQEQHSLSHTAPRLTPDVTINHGLNLAIT